MSDRGRFEGRVAVVTGAGGFIGGAICRRLVAEGADVRGLDIDPGAATRVANVIEAAAAAGAARVVHISSVVVHGYDDASEQDETAFRRAYGIPYIDTKSASDRLAAAARS